MENTPVTTAISKLSFEGNIIPHTWYSTIVKRDSKGKRPHLTAIIILSDIISRCKGDRLQRNYNQIGKQFGLSYKVTMQAVKFLEKIGAITLELRNIQTESGTIQNVMYIQPVIPVIQKLTNP